MNALVASGLGKQYRRRWALRDCTLQIPRGRIVALVGPNGSGKTTLLHLAAGLIQPTEGSISVEGGIPGKDRDLLPKIGLVAQDVPLYRGFTVAETLELGRRLNARWDDRLAEARLERLGVPRDQRVGELSGGQRAQVALALALGKRPDVLLLDEPLASLDPLARREFMRTLLDSATETGSTIILSSHLVADLERTCDYLILLSASRIQVAGDIDELLRTHSVMTGPRTEVAHIDGVESVVEQTHTDRQTTMLVRTRGRPILDPAWSAERISLEEIVLAYLSHPEAVAIPSVHVALAAGAMTS
jgi:ABC-2 type transport system ATP-binding protein